MKKFNRQSKRILAWFAAIILFFTSGTFDWIPGNVKSAKAEEVSTITLSNAQVFSCSYSSSNFTVGSSQPFSSYEDNSFSQKTITSSTAGNTDLYLDVNTAVTFNIACPTGITWGANITDNNTQNTANGVVYASDTSISQSNYNNGTAGLYFDPSNSSQLTICAGSNPTSSKVFYFHIFPLKDGSTTSTFEAFQFKIHILKKADTIAIHGSPDIVAGQSRTFSAEMKPTNTTDSIEWIVSDKSLATMESTHNSSDPTEALMKAEKNTQGQSFDLTAQAVPGITSTGNNITAIEKRTFNGPNKTAITEPISATALSFDQSTYAIDKNSKNYDLASKLTKTPDKATDNLTWFSDNTSVATVNQNGQVNTNSTVGEATITVKGDNVSTTCKIQVGNVDGLLSKFNLSIPDSTFNNQSQQPANTELSYPGGKLQNGTAYKIIKYSNNKDAGTASVEIQGINNYAGTATIPFKILPASLSTATINPISDQTFTGTAIEPSLSVKVKLDGKDVTLSKDKDYTVTYSNNTNAGTATAKITGIGNYTGSTSTTFKILPKAISSVSFDSIPQQTFSYQPITPTLNGTISNSKATGGKITLKSGTDYSVSYENNENYGTAKVTITGQGNFTGTTTKTFSIARASIDPEKNAKIVLKPIEKQFYRASNITPIPNIQLNGKTLIEGTDYKIEYKDNYSVGTATVKLTGQGNFQDSLSTTFEIYMGKSEHPATNISITKEDGSALDKDTIYIDVNKTSYFPLKVTNDSNNCDDVVAASINAGDQLLSGGTVDAKGTTATLAVSGKKPGVTTIYLTTMSGKIQKTINVVIYQPATTIKINYTDPKTNQKTDITGAQLSMPASNSLQLSTTYTPSNSTDTVSWSVSDSNVAKVNEDGLLSLLKPGTVTVTAKVKPTENDARGLTATTMLTVIENTPIKEITIDKTLINLRPNQTEKITATVNPENYTEQLLWKTSDPKVATVNSAGQVTGVAKGTAKITCSNFQGNIVETCIVKVATPATAMTMSTSAQTIFKGQSFNLTACLQPSTADEDIIWTTSNKKVASVKASGKMNAGKQKAIVKGLSTGKCTITAKSALTGRVMTCTVRVIKLAKPGKVTIKSAKSTKKKAVALKWKAVSHAKGYQVSYSTSKNFKGAKTKNFSLVSKSLTGLSSKKYYYIRIRAYNKSGSVKLYGSWSKTKKVKIK